MHPPDPQPPPRRLVSIDAYRGMVMLLMMAEVLRLCAVARARPESRFWSLLCHHQTHVEWVGCSLHDLIQPSFSFLVGVALPFSLAARIARGQPRARMTAHALVRALVLVLLGIFLRSIGHARTHFTFEDTLTQIGLGYPVLFALGFRPPRDRWIALAVILIGSWAAFALYPLPGPEFVSARVGVPAAWPHRLGGFAAHWNKNSNLAWAVDTWFLNLFPRETPFDFNRHDGPRPDRRRCPAGRPAGLGQGHVAGRRGRRHAAGGLVGGRTRALPGGQADLDAELGPLQRRLVLPAPGGV
jgi:heparan-alpha-glucosaminide N-acetyltransferase